MRVLNDNMTVDISQLILNKLSTETEINSLLLSNSINESHQKIVGAIKSLESLENVVNVSMSSSKCWHCTEEGQLISKEGSHEARLVAWLPESGATVDDIKKKFSNANVALGAALKNKWVKKDGTVIIAVQSNIKDEVQEHLRCVSNGKAFSLSDKQLQDYKKRKLIKDSDVTVFTVTKGICFSTNVCKLEAELTKEMIESGQWKTKNFKPFNFKSKGKQDTRPGHLHPLMQLRSEFRQIFLEMGFTEMPTNSFVESAFWNFDALFQPQQHPARDAHDTFYVKNPGRALSVPTDYMEKVKKVHSCGGFGSSGYRYAWDIEEAHKNLLRTHTTAVSARMLRKLAEDGFRPAKYFSIDRVFRNETLDATHLAEFHQIEGVVADYNLSVKHLIGMFTAFFEKIGIRNLRFKATYNPYTEPSMEVYSFHNGLGKWVEVGNSGLFRPEMLRPMGLPENVAVLGWGLSLERPAMIMFGSNNIRELVGPRVKMELVFSNPVCTVDKFQPTSLLPPSSCYPAPPLPSCKGPALLASEEEAVLVLSRRQDRIFDQLSALQQRVQHLACDMNVELVTTPTGDSVVPRKHSARSAESCLSLLTGAPSPSDFVELVVTADPRRPPHFLPPVLRLLAKVAPLTVLQHVHSSVLELPPSVEGFLGSLEQCGGREDSIVVRLIWSQALPLPDSPRICSSSRELSKASAKHRGGSLVQPPRLLASPICTTEISGENNICRYLARLLELLQLQKNKTSQSDAVHSWHLYEGLPRYLASQCDAWLDDCQTWLITGSSRGRANFLNKLSNKLVETEERSGFLLEEQPTLADVFVSSSLAVLGKTCRVAFNVGAWRKRCHDLWGDDDVIVPNCAITRSKAS